MKSGSWRDGSVAVGGVSTLGVVDIGASAIRLVVAEILPDSQFRILEEASRGVLLGKDTFTHGRLTPPTAEAAIRALEGYRKIMESYGVGVCRAVATSAVREAANRDGFLDRVRMRTGLEVEVIDGSEENRLTYLAVRGALRDHESLRQGATLVVEVGGGSTEISLLRSGEPVFAGTYALGAIRMRQNFAAWRGSHDRRIRLLRRSIQNVVEDIKREMPLAEAAQFVALGGDVRFAAARLRGEEAEEGVVAALGREEFGSFCDEVAALEVDDLVQRYRLAPADAETLAPALLAYRELLLETEAQRVMVPEASLRLGLLLDMLPAAGVRGVEDFDRQVLASAEAMAVKYRCDMAHARVVAHLAGRLFDELRTEHGLAARDRLLLQAAALLHEVGTYIHRRSHHKHSQYILSMSDVFGLTREDMALIGNVARYHRRALPQKSHPLYMSLDRETRVRINKLAAMLRVANALDADHLQCVRDLKVIREEDGWVLEVQGTGDLTMERHAMQARADLFLEVFGQKLGFRETGQSP